MIEGSVAYCGDKARAGKRDNRVAGHVKLKDAPALALPGLKRRK